MYAEVPPPPRLAARLDPLVECFWTVRSRGPLREIRPERILPDGGSDIIVNLGDLPHPEGCPHWRLRSYVVGTMTRAIRVRLRSRVDLVGVRFRPGGAAPFVAPPARELTDRAVELAALWPRARELEARLAEAPDPVRAFAEVLASRLADAPDADPRVLRAAGLMERSDGRIPVGKLGEGLEIGTRHLERLFARDVGVPPKVACRILRFRAAIRILRQRPTISWSHLAYEAGYFDQPHLTREFRSFAGITPEAYRREQSGDPPGGRTGRRGGDRPFRDVASVQDAERQPR